VDIARLHRVMRDLPVRSAMRYHRWSREDIENLEGAQTKMIIEMGRLHRAPMIMETDVRTHVS
jgi:hypothetical protein